MVQLCGGATTVDSDRVAAAAVRLRVAEAVSAGVLFYSTAAAAQRTMGALRITSASWVAAPSAGLVTVMLGSCVAGHGAVTAGNALSLALTAQLAHPDHANYLQSTTAFGAIGLLSFWLLGGKCGMLCPSDLRYLGAYARLGIPCTVEYADSAMRARVQVRHLSRTVLARRARNGVLLWLARR
mgnify:CR=1 FL=1